MIADSFPLFDFAGRRPVWEHNLCQNNTLATSLRAIRSIPTWCMTSCRRWVFDSLADFRVFSMKHSKVYLYEERHSHAQVVGKFFVNGGHDKVQAMQRMHASGV